MQPGGYFDVCGLLGAQLACAACTANTPHAQTGMLMTAARLLHVWAGEVMCVPRQIVYLLELPLTLITTAYDAQHMVLPDMRSVPGVLRQNFAPDGQHILVVWSRLGPQTCGCDVHSRQGQRVAHFELGDVNNGSTTPPAFARDNRVAIACGSSLTVWDLLSGQHLGTLRPLGDAVPEGGWEEGDLEDNGVVAANRKGCKLAFVAANACDVHLYDAATLAKLGCVRAHAGVQSRLGFGNAHVLEYGVYGWFLLHQGFGAISARLFIVRPEPCGGSTSKDHTWRDSCGENIPVPAASPDGAFLAFLRTEDATLCVMDLRTGDLVISVICILQGCRAPGAGFRQKQRCAKVCPLNKLNCTMLCMILMQVGSFHPSLQLLVWLLQGGTA